MNRRGFLRGLVGGATSYFVFGSGLWTPRGPEFSTYQILGTMDAAPGDVIFVQTGSLGSGEYVKTRDGWWIHKSAWDMIRKGGWKA